MNAQVIQIIRWESWTLSEEADRRFRRIVLMVGVPALILAILISIFQMETKKTETVAYTTTRSIELAASAQKPAEEVAKPEEPKPAEKAQEKQQQAAPPKPQPKVKPQENPVPQEKPVPVPVPQPSARELAQKTQEMKVIQDQLQDLRDQNLNTLSDQPLVSGTISSKGGVSGASAESIAQSAAANSGNGIGGVGSVTSTQSGTGLGTRRTGSVKSPLGFGRDVGKAGANGKVDNGRTVQELQEIFDRNKGALTAIYNRQARENTNMGDGKLVVRLTIAPDGSVTQCVVLSSSFNDPDFEHKIVQRIFLFRFQAKDVPPFTYDSYPIEFHPM